MKNVYESILAIIDNGVNSVTTEELEAVRAFASDWADKTAENAKKKAENAQFYAAAKTIVLRVLKNAASPMSIADITRAVMAAEDCPNDVKAARIQYGILHYWTDEIAVIKNGKNPNTYTLKGKA